MRLDKLVALPHPAGNRIDLRWVNPDPAAFPGVRVVRRAGTHPTGPDDGAIVAEGVGLTAATDTGLQGETVYYYLLFPFKPGPPVTFDPDWANRTAALATAPYDHAGQLYELLPAIYRRYDTSLPASPPPGMDPADAARGQLRRFLDLPGGQFDILRSLARATLDLRDLDRVDGRLLPLLAGWIGWRTDHSREIAAQRAEVANASALYQTTGLVPNLEATVQRVIGRASRTKEFVHNVLRTNEPESLTLWALRRANGGTWQIPTAPLSLDAAPAGRPAALRDAGDNLWLFYRRVARGRSQLWHKRAPAGQEDAWGPSQPLSAGQLVVGDATAALDGDAIWVFWSTFDPVTRTWGIRSRTRDAAGVWSPEEPFAIGGPAERRAPSAVADDAGGLWLFWLERDGDEWPLKYARRVGGAWGASVAFPRDTGASPRVEADHFALFHPVGGPTRRLWLFWARQEPTAGGGQARWSLVYRTKSNLTDDDTGWGGILPISAAPATANEREPAAVVDGGTIELFLSSDRGGSRSIWRSRFDLPTGAWGAQQALTTEPYTERAPLALAGATDLWVFHRANRPITRRSTLYSATTTDDLRHAGGTSADTRNVAKLALHGRYDDFHTYSYATGPGGRRRDADRAARDTVGIYWDPGLGPGLRDEGSEVVRALLREFLPIQVRPVLIEDPDA